MALRQAQDAGMQPPLHRASLSRHQRQHSSTILLYATIRASFTVLGP